MERRIINLTDQWDFSLPGGRIEKRRVPGSYPCIGDSVYSCVFDCPYNPGSRVLLCFDGICYEARIEVNNVLMGVMLPYSRYEFDITSVMKDINRVTVYLKDIHAAYGWTEGWRNYSGIVRAVYLKIVPNIYIKDVFFHASFEKDFRIAKCVAEVQIDGSWASSDGIPVAAVLHYEGVPIACGEAVLSECKAVMQFSVDNPMLWSPNRPELYELAVSVFEDTHVQVVGLKSLEARGNRFILNGKPIFLAGVCRHDLWDDGGGFTQTDEQIEMDMRMIKGMGANFIRLVHYPHDKRVIDAADRLGLLVSCEPGLWVQDLTDERLTSGALKVFENVILRDRSNVSVAFWLAFNECVLVEKYLRDAVAIVRRFDPTRMVSGANNINAPRTKLMFDEAGFDFYTYHPYGSAPSHVSGGIGGTGPSTLKDIAAVLSAKPLVFTEWGGFYVVGNPALFTWFCNEMRMLYDNAAPDCALAGMSYWLWSDIYEANRGDEACVNGLQIEGLVTTRRSHKSTYDAYARFLAGRHCKKSKKLPESIILTSGESCRIYTPLLLPDVITDTQQQAWDSAMISSLKDTEMILKFRRLEFGPVLPEPIYNLGAMVVSLRQGRPLVINETSGTIKIAVNKPAGVLCFIGQALLSYGYPINGIFGERFGSYDIRYADGSIQSIDLRNGCEATTVQGTLSSTLIEPRGTNITPAIRIIYDQGYEIYQINLLEVKASTNISIEDITVRVEAPQYSLLLYGIAIGN